MKRRNVFSRLLGWSAALIAAPVLAKSATPADGPTTGLRIEDDTGGVAPMSGTITGIWVRTTDGDLFTGTGSIRVVAGANYQFQLPEEDGAVKVWRVCPCGRREQVG